MLTYTTITQKDTQLSGEIAVAPTKKITKRSLIIHALKSSKSTPKVVAEKDRVDLFDQSVRHKKTSADIEKPDKALRFLRAFLSFFGGEWIIFGGKEMQNSPVADVIKYLQSHGQNIRFEVSEGFPPLKLVGRYLQGDILQVEASICSQFISTSLDISSALSHQQVIELKDWIVNSPYISQTLRWLNYLGVNTGWNKEEMLIEHTLSDEAGVTLEGDWMVASYWYPMVAFVKKSSIQINGIPFDSLQPHSFIKELFEPLGVNTVPVHEGIVIEHSGKCVKSFQANLGNNPDLILATLITCVGLKVPCRIEGVKSLRTHEVDRLMVLQSQMLKLGVKLQIEKQNGEETIIFDGKTGLKKDETIEIDTFSDHRILMAFVPLAALGAKVVVNHPRVVSRSYANFWSDLKHLGFFVE